MTRRELILYATPVGPLAEAIEAYFGAVEPTTANDYPPHCTLTGFFHRRPARANEIADEVRNLVASTGPVPEDGVVVRDLHLDADWVGLELHSPFCEEFTARFVAEHQSDPTDDALRPKDWLHLSLAYGVDDLTTHAATASEVIDPALPCTWEIALWERSGAAWTRLS